MAMLPSEQARKWRRQAEKYRMLADCACADSARETYEALADDYDNWRSITRISAKQQHARGIDDAAQFALSPTRSPPSRR
jgi:hypothetical protein